MMKTNNPKRVNGWRLLSRRSSAVHNPWLVLNLALFNFGGGLGRVVAREQLQQFGR